MTCPYEWFSIQIHTTWSYRAGGCAVLPHRTGDGLEVVGGAVEVTGEVVVTEAALATGELGDELEQPATSVRASSAPSAHLIEEVRTWVVFAASHDDWPLHARRRPHRADNAFV